MVEAIRLLGMSLLLLALLTALGSGPALALGRGLVARSALAPVAGLALAGALLTTAGAVLEMRIAAFAVLLPAAALSLTWAVVASRTGGGGERAPRSDLLVPLGLGAAALLLATLPALLHGTVGPFALLVDDAWSYVPADLWLTQNTIDAELPAATARSNLTLADGWILTDCGCRLGVTTLGGAYPKLLGTTPDQTHLAQLAAIFALLPAVIFFAARNLGVAARPAALGAAFGLSPALLMLVGDSVLGNLAGLAIVPALLVAGALALRSEDWRLPALAALLGAGLVAGYPEFVLTTLVVAAAGWAALAIGRPDGWPSPGAAAARLGVVVLGAAILAPVASLQPIEYFGELSDRVPAGLDRFLTVPDVGSWALGVQHLYELQRFDQLSALKTLVVVGLPLALLGLLVAGIARRRGTGLFLVAAPLLAAVALGLAAYLRFEDCQYCLWRSLTYGLPFIALGLAIAAETVPPWLRARFEGSSARVRSLAAAAPIALIAVGLLAIARADTELTRAVYRSAAITETDSRGLTDAIRDLGPAPRVLVEGTDSTAAGTWGVEEAYYLSRLPENAEVSLDGRPRTLLPSSPPSAFYSPDYRYVVSVFGDLESGREPVSRHGPYALFRRAPIDIALMRSGYSLDPRDGESAIPWLQGPFQLWVSSPRASRGSVTLRLNGPLAAQAPIQLSVAGRPLATSRSGAAICADVPLRAGRTIIEGHTTLPPGVRTFPARGELQLAVGPQLDLRLRPTESDAIAPPPMLLGLGGVEGRLAPCPQPQG